MQFRDCVTDHSSCVVVVSYVPSIPSRPAHPEALDRLDRRHATLVVVMVPQQTWPLLFRLDWWVPTKIDMANASVERFDCTPRGHAVDHSIPEALQRKDEGAHVLEPQRHSAVVDNRVDPVRARRDSCD